MPLRGASITGHFRELNAFFTSRVTILVQALFAGDGSCLGNETEDVGDRRLGAELVGGSSASPVLVEVLEDLVRDARRAGSLPWGEPTDGLSQFV